MTDDLARALEDARRVEGNDVWPEPARRIARALLEQSAEVERLRAAWDEECTIVDRLWRILASDPPPTYEQLGGRSIYDFATDAKAAESRADSLADEVERLKHDVEQLLGAATEEATRADSIADEVRRLREALGDARNNGLIYWEPRTSRGAKEKALMLGRIDVILNEVANG